MNNNINSFKQEKLNTSRNYVFTSYCPIQTDKLKNLSEIKYICWGNETCPKTGNKHQQGYLELKEPMRYSSLIKKITNEDSMIWFQKRLGTQEQAISYCMKDNDFHESGEKAKQGKRSDLSHIYESIRNGENIKDLWDDNPEEFSKYHKAFEKYATLVQPTRNWQTELEIYFGDAGTGKSRKAHEENPDAYDLLIPNSDTIWFDGYNGHDTVIIDDFYGNMPISMLLKLADRYAYRVPVKGGSTNFCPKKIIITSNVHPALWYKNIDVKLKEAFARRITKITEFKNEFLNPDISVITNANVTDNCNEVVGNRDTTTSKCNVQKKQYNKMISSLEKYEDIYKNDYINSFESLCLFKNKHNNSKEIVIFDKINNINTNINNIILF